MTLSIRHVLSSVPASQASISLALRDGQDQLTYFCETQPFPKSKLRDLKRRALGRYKESVELKVRSCSLPYMGRVRRRVVPPTRGLSALHKIFVSTVIRRVMAGD